MQSWDLMTYGLYSRIVQQMISIQLLYTSPNLLWTGTIFFFVKKEEASTADCVGTPIN